MHTIYKFFDKLEDKVRGFLSHYPIGYGFIAGTGIILFGRGIWHSVDTMHQLIFQYSTSATIDAALTPWWDGPFSLVVGTCLLLISGTFVSSFIGNEIIMTGLRGEKKLTEKTETELRTEVGAIADIKAKLDTVLKRLDDLEKK